MAKNIADIVFGGSNEEFVWRSPITDFETGSKLTVYESQEALFYFNGACVGVLGAGSHILETERIPFLKGLLQKITGEKTIFHAQVYFVNKVELDMKWGVGDIVYQDPAGPVFNIGCFGQMNLSAVNSRKIVEKLVGSQSSLTRTHVITKFKEILSAEVTDKLVNTMLANDISIIDLNAKKLEISNLLIPILADLFSNYGFSVEQFRISGLNIPTNDPEYHRLTRLRSNERMQLKELQLKQQEQLMLEQIEAQKMRMQADAMAYKRQVEGYDYATEKRFEFLGKMAEHDGVGAGLSSEMLQMGAGLGMMGAVGGMMQEAMGGGSNPMNSMMYSVAGTQPPQQYGYGVPQQTPVAPQPAPEAPQQAAAPVQEDPIAVLKKLKALLDAGLIEQSEYDAKKQEVLSRL